MIESTISKTKRKNEIEGYTLYYVIAFEISKKRLDDSVVMI